MTTQHKHLPLPRPFYLRDANTVAPELLGKLLVHRSPEGVTAGIIVEVESYIGSRDKGAHSYPNKRTPRTAVQFGQGGYAYIYTIYGLHTCFNIVTNDAEKPEVVLIRALEPVTGIDLMQQRRHTDKRDALCSGPGKLCQAMAITKSLYGCDLCGTELYLEPFQMLEANRIMVSPRINIDYAEECAAYLWRYFIAGNPYVSAVPKKYQDRQKPYSPKFSSI